MITIFTFLNDVLCNKEGNLLTSIDIEQQYQPYLINRWISMYSPRMAKLVNNTVNRFWTILQNKKDHYKFLVGVLPQSPQRRIAYIKKVKPEKEKDFSEVITKLAQNLQISKREVITYIDMLELDLTPYMKALKPK